MRAFITLLLSCFLLHAGAQTQGELNAQAAKEYGKADKELNRMYQQLLKDYSEDTVFINNFKAAQRLWIQFRDAEMKARFPDRGPGYYGSVHSMCWSTQLTRLTNERIKVLKEWIDGVKEGDTCAGSIRTED